MIQSALTRLSHFKGSFTCSLPFPHREDLTSFTADRVPRLFANGDGWICFSKRQLLLTQGGKQQLNTLLNVIMGFRHLSSSQYVLLEN